MIGRIAKHPLAAADQHRHVGLGEMKPIQQILNPFIPIEIDEGVRMAVAGQEFLDPQGSRAMSRPDEHHIADPPGNELNPAKDEGPHEDIAQFTVRLHQREKPLSIDFDHFSRLADPYAGQSGSTREQGHFAGEHARPERGHQFFGCGQGPDDVDSTFGDEEEPGRSPIRWGR
ncbi:MAG: hypothetical protein HY650_04730 [Acidobacteria bacterium]|nr:hypothetical protein [Acidobacteriota bacterium]